MPRSFVRKMVGCVLAMAGALAPAGVDTIQAQPQDAFEPPRKRMVEEIAALVRETRHETGRAALSERVMEAMLKVPRHEFVPAAEQRNAYANRPLPIGRGQTISQPFIVALMTDLMDIKRSEEHTSELQSLRHLVCRLLLEKKKKKDKESAPNTLHDTN